MDFISFQAETYRTDFSAALEELLPSLKSSQDAVSKSALEMIVAMERSIDVMERVDADQNLKSKEYFQLDDITQIGEYSLTLLDEISTAAANRGLQHSVPMLYQLSMPVAMWVASHGGVITKLDIIVNAIATYANKLTDTHELEMFSEVIRRTLFSVSDEIKQDMEATNPMRPWRIINLNWGIVATRCHNAELMETVFDQLIKNIPADVAQFFAEGMQQMDVINYPDHVKSVMEKYNNLFKNDGHHTLN